LSKYLYNLALAFDQFVNALLLGDPDESISGRTGRAIASGRAKWWVKPLATHIDWMFCYIFGEKNHVANAIEPEEKPLERELWSWIKT
jgi:hypothetical protein